MKKTVFFIFLMSFVLKGSIEERKMILLVIGDKNCLSCELKISELIKKSSPINSDIYLLIEKDTFKTREYNDYLAKLRYPFISHVIYFQEQDSISMFQEKLNNMDFDIILTTLVQSPSPIIYAYSSRSWSYFLVDEIFSGDHFSSEFLKYFHENF